jgi:SAM-dependent methyltransferase
MDERNIKAEVQKHYARIAQGGGCCGGEPCPAECAAEPSMVSYGELAEDVVAGANLGLGCGLPTQYAGIKPGDTVLDLGSGAGVDVFIAAKAVGPEGHVIGVDMTPEMLQRAWTNAVKGGYRNVEFRLGDIEALPVNDNSVDVVVSNCVINLAPDKRRVFAEICRVLKSGGRFAISDIVTHGHVPEKIRQDVEMWAGCVAGALDREIYLQVIRDAGFPDVRVNQIQEYDYPQGADYGFASITVEGQKP